VTQSDPRSARDGVYCPPQTRSIFTAPAISLRLQRAYPPQKRVDEVATD